MFLHPVPYFIGRKALGLSNGVDVCKTIMIYYLSELFNNLVGTTNLWNREELHVSEDNGGRSGCGVGN